MTEAELRIALIENARTLEQLNVNQGTSGNLSARCGNDMLITPSAVPYDRLTPQMIAKMPVRGDYGAWSGPLPPSSEWRIHLDILRAKPEVGAVIHTHALHATTLSLMHMPIPAVHYMIAAFGGPTIRCTKYAPFGTKELSKAVLEGLLDRHGVLLGQHGMVVTGKTVGEAMWRAVELETLAKMYLLALSVGRPFILPDDEIARTIEKFKNYGYRPDKLVTLERQAKDPDKQAPAKKLKAANKAMQQSETRQSKENRAADDKPRRGAKTKPKAKANKTKPKAKKSAKRK